MIYTTANTSESILKVAIFSNTNNQDIGELQTTLTNLLINRTLFKDYILGTTEKVYNNDWLEYKKMQPTERSQTDPRSIQDFIKCLKLLNGQIELLPSSPSTSLTFLSNFNIKHKGIITSSSVFKINFEGNQLKHNQCNSIFLANLQMVDTLLPELVAELIPLYYNEHRRTLRELMLLLIDRNPLKYPVPSCRRIYETRLRRLLISIAQGLTGNSVWFGLINNELPTNFNRIGNITIYIDPFYTYSFESFLLENTILSCTLINSILFQSPSLRCHKTITISIGFHLTVKL